MQAEHKNAKRILLLFAAVLLLVAPIHGQTLQANADKIILGQVLGCNDFQVITLKSSGATLTASITITYPANNLQDGWLYARNQATGATINGNGNSAGPLNVTVPINGSVDLVVGLNRETGVSNNATVTLTTTSPVGQTLILPVTMSINTPCNPLVVRNETLGVFPGYMQMTTSQGNSYTLSAIVSNLSNVPQTFTFVPNPRFPWISVGLTSVTLQPGQWIAMPVTVSAGTLPPGSYDGIIFLAQGQGVGLFINVTMIVTSNGVGPSIATGVKSTSNVIKFTYVPEGRIIPGQVVTISNQVGTAPIPFAVSVTQYNGPANWLTTNWNAGATTPFELAISASNLNLTPGITYQGSITITPYLGPALVIYVALEVTAPPVVVATPKSITFTYTQGQAAPPPQVVTITGLNNNVVSYSTQAPIPSWLKTFPVTGSAPNGSLPFGPGMFMNVVVDPTGLAPGTYTGTVTVYGNGPAVGNNNITVTLIVSGPVIKSTLNSASFSAGRIAPGEMVTIFADDGGDIGPTDGVGLTGDLIVDNQLPTAMGDVQVLFGDTPAPLIYVSARQINCVVPYEVSGQAHVAVTVKFRGLASAPMSMPVVETHPAMFTSTASGIGQAAVGQYDDQGRYRGINSADNPAVRGGVLTLYVTGEGRLNSAITGRVTTVAPSAPYTPQPKYAPSVLIDGQPATVTFYGAVPGVVEGMMQINVIVPKSIRTGTAVPISVTIGSGYSQAGVTIAAQ